jgi:hypothetical protein
MWILVCQRGKTVIMPSDFQQPEAEPLSQFRRRIVALLSAAALLGTALLITIVVMGPIRLAELQPGWIAVFMVSLAAIFVWWWLYLWLLGRIAGLSPWQGMGRSVALLVLLSLSLLPVAAVFLAGRLPFPLVFDAALRSLYIWMLGLSLFVAFLGQELVLASAARKMGLGESMVALLRPLSALPLWLGRLPGTTVRQVRQHPLLVAILALGIVQRWQILYDYHPGDMNDLLSVVYTILSGPPFRYYHDYSPQTYIFAHLPLMPIAVAPFYWLFENVAKLPTFMAVKLVSTVGDMVVATIIYSQAKGRWKGSWGLILAATWMISPLVASNDDRPVGMAAAFAVAAFAVRRKPLLCGVLIALGAATRTEVGLLALPLIVHFLTKRELREKVVFLGAFVTTLGVVALPFVLTDPEAIDFALRRQGQRQASGQASMLLLFLQTQLSGGVGSWLQQNPSFFPLLVTLGTALLALRDRRVMRVGLVVALGYILTIPVLHDHYTVFFYAVGLLYAASYGNPLIAIAIVMAAGWGPINPSLVQIALVVAMAVFSLLRIDRPRQPAMQT